MIATVLSFVAGTPSLGSATTEPGRAATTELNASAIRATPPACVPDDAVPYQALHILRPAGIPASRSVRGEADPCATETTAQETASGSSASSALTFPTIDSAGVPRDWAPNRIIYGTYKARADGEVIEDARVYGSLSIEAENVVVRRVEIIGGRIFNNNGDGCFNGLLIEDTSIVRHDGQDYEFGIPAVTSGGYTARNVLIDGATEGFRIGGTARGCGPVVIESSYVRIAPPDGCTPRAWHGDALQGYEGQHVTVRSTVLETDGHFDEGCGGNAAFFYPDQGNASATIDGLIVMGGGYPFRLHTPATVNELYVVDGAWGFGPLSVTCGPIVDWDAHVARLDADGQPIVVQPLPCED